MPTGLEVTAQVIADVAIFVGIVAAGWWIAIQVVEFRSTRRRQ